MIRTNWMLGISVVTYQQSFVETPAFRSLSRLPEELRCRLLVVSVCNAARREADGGQRIVRVRAVNLDYTEIFCSDNPGLAGGYNKGVPILIQAGAAAVLFLNADSEVPKPFVAWLLDAMSEQSMFAGFAPTLYSNSLRVSPFRKRGFDYPFYIIAFLCLRAGPFLRNLEFPQEHWLDGIDYWLSAKLAENNLGIKVSPLSIAHDLAVSDQFETLPAWRYRNILISERTFLRSQRRPFFEIGVIYLRALARCLRFRRFDLARVVMQEFSVALHG